MAGREGVGEEVGARALAQQLHDLAAARRVAAGSAAHRLAQRAREDVDRVPGRRTSSGVPRPASPTKPTAWESSTIVSASWRSARSQIADRFATMPSIEKTPSVATSLKRAPAASASLQLRLEVGHVVVAVPVALRLAQADAVDDARVVQLVADHRVLLAQQGLEEAAVRVEAARVQDAVVHAEEGGEGALQLLVDRLRAADEPHRGHAVAVAVERRLAGGHQPRIVGEAEVVVRAEVEDFRAVGEADGGRLRARDDALGLVEAVGADLGERVPDVGQIAVAHGGPVLPRGWWVAAYLNPSLRRNDLRTRKKARATDGESPSPRPSPRGEGDFRSLSLGRGAGGEGPA